MGPGVVRGASGGGRRGRRRRGKSAAMSEINVTPFVDVMLVLLIVFMVAAPLMTVGVPVDLPKAEAPAINEQTEPLVVSIDGSGKLFIQETPIATKDLIPRLRAITKNKAEQRIFVRGDKKISYGRVMEVMANLSAAGFTKVALIAETPER